MIWIAGIYLIGSAGCLVFLRAVMREFFWPEIHCALVWSALWPIFASVLIYEWKVRGQ